MRTKILVPLIAIITCLFLLVPASAQAAEPDQAQLTAATAVGAYTDARLTAAPVALAPTDLSDVADWAKKKAQDVGRGGVAAVGWLKDKVSGAGAMTQIITGIVTRNPAAVGTGFSQLAGQAGGQALGSLIEVAFKWLASSLGSAAAWILSMVLDAAFTASSPDLSADVLYTWAGRTFAIAIPIMAGLALWQIATSAIALRAPHGVRRALLGAAGATIASMLTLPVSAVLSRAVDAISGGLLAKNAADTQQLAERVSDLFSTTTFTAMSQVDPVTGAAVAAQGTLFMLIVFVIFCGMSVLAGILLMVVLAVRSAGLEVVEVAAPIAWAGLASHTTRSWPRQIVSAIVALCFAKLGVVLVLGLGTAVLLQSGPGKTVPESVGQMAMVMTMFIVAGFVPWITFKMFDFLGETTVATVTSQGRNDVRQGRAAFGGTLTMILSAAGTRLGLKGSREASSPSSTGPPPSHNTSSQPQPREQQQARPGPSREGWKQA